MTVFNACETDELQETIGHWKTDLKEIREKTSEHR